MVGESHPPRNASLRSDPHLCIGTGLAKRGSLRAKHALFWDFSPAQASMSKRKRPRGIVQGVMSFRQRRRGIPRDLVSFRKSSRAIPRGSMLFRQRRCGIPRDLMSFRKSSRGIPRGSMSKLQTCSRNHASVHVETTWTQCTCSKSGTYVHNRLR